MIVGEQHGVDVGERFEVERWVGETSALDAGAEVDVVACVEEVLGWV